jgi:hypothetical protein
MYAIAAVCSPFLHGILLVIGTYLSL